MSTRQIGNGHENSVMTMAESLGYATFAARGSRGPVDVLCFPNEDACRCEFKGSDHICMFWFVPLVIQVGTTNKAIHRTLIELDEAPRPIGSLCVVARRHKHKTSKRISWTFHINGETKILSFDSLAALLEAR